MAKAKRRILLAYGEKGFSQKLKRFLGQKGYTVTLLREGIPSKAKYDVIVQIGRDPVDLAEGTRDLLEKVAKDKSRFFLIHFRTDERLYDEASAFAKTLILEFEQKKGITANILNLARIYGPNVAEKDSGALAHLIREFAEEEFLTIYAEGKDSDYYLFINDALEGIARAIQNAQAGKTYAISSSVPITSEAAAKLLFELGGGRHEIRFHRGLTALKERGKVEGKPLPNFKPQIPFRKGVLAILKTQPEPSVLKKAKTKHLPKIRAPLIKLKLKKPSQRVLLTSGIVFLLLAPFLYLGGEAGITLFHFTKTKEALQQFDFETAQRSAILAGSSLGRLGKIIPVAKAGAEVSDAIAEISAQGSVLDTALENLARSYRGEETTLQKEEDFRNLSRALDDAEESLLMAWIEVIQAGNPWQKYLSVVKEGLEEGLAAVQLASAFTDQAWDLLGYKGVRNYLVLFQNSAELRAGGGFLGSLAQLTLSEGGIEALEFFDSYQFDSQKSLAAHPALKKLRKANKTSLRDSNFPASFPQSAQDIISIFEDAQDTTIDGVIGTTLIFTKDLLSVTGELNLTEFEKTVTAENLFETTTQEVEQDFFPGSTKKKRFLQALGESLLGKVFSLDKGKYSQLARASWKALGEKNLLFYFKKGSLAQALLTANFDGRVATSEGTDYLLVLDSNFGTKVNELWIKRETDYKVKNIDRRGTLQGQLTITWNHTGTEAWPSGTYRNLLRVLVPKGARLTQALLNEENYLSKIITLEEAGKTEFAAYLSIKPQSTAVLELTYRLPNSLNSEELKTYSLSVQKQPGTVGDSFAFTFEEPFGKQISGEGLQKEGNNLILKKDLERDIALKVTIEAKEEGGAL